MPTASSPGSGTRESLLQLFPIAGGESMPAPVDWEAIEQSAEFRELVARRRRFVLPATIFFLSWYLGFILLAGYAEDFMGSSIYEGFTVGYLLALSQFVMVWGLGWSYLRKADREFDPLEREVVALAERGELSDTLDTGPRLEHTPAATTDPEVTR
jgi:uncharacterized membrane protein (DUF485 family)